MDRKGVCYDTGRIVPCGTVRSMPSSTVFSPKDLRRPRAEIEATAVVAPVVDITVVHASSSRRGARRMVTSPSLVLAWTSTLSTGSPASGASEEASSL
jgi:hypothetical protein